MNEIGEGATKFIKDKNNTRMLIRRFADPHKIYSDEMPISIFMAGSPGAGKTEFSKILMNSLQATNKNAVRIDADEIRELLPGYTGNNAYQLQGACSVGVEKLHDSVLKNNQNFILDGTLSNYSKAKNNIERSLSKGRPINIIYVYQDPINAWEFTQAREKIDGRRIKLSIFVEQLFASRKVVDQLKKEYGDKINVYCIQKDFKYRTIDFNVVIDDIDKYAKIPYTKDQLIKQLTN